MNRNISLDVLKITLAVMVVGLHANLLKDISPLINYLTVNGVFRVAVPLFTCINGFFFYRTLTENRAAQWFKRISILYITWMFIYSYFWFPEIDGDIIAVIARLLLTWVTGYSHLWYLMGILGAALLIVATKNVPIVILVTITGVAFLCGVCIQYAGYHQLMNSSYLNSIFNNYASHRNFLFFSFPFFFIGFSINKYKLHKKFTRERTYLLAIFGLALLLCESMVNYIQPHRDRGFDNFISLIIVCPAIFLLFISCQIEGVGNKIALYANGIYFSHVFFMMILSSDIFNLKATPLTISTVFVSVFFCYFVIKNKRLAEFIF